MSRWPALWAQGNCARSAKQVPDKLPHCSNLYFSANNVQCIKNTLVEKNEDNVLLFLPFHMPEGRIFFFSFLSPKHYNRHKPHVYRQMLTKYFPSFYLTWQTTVTDLTDNRGHIYVALSAKFSHVMSSFPDSTVDVWTMWSSLVIAWASDSSTHKPLSVHLDNKTCCSISSFMTIGAK